ncbi:MAG TPA: nuclease-related domain-containing protein [Kiritimatiellia bacterium]|nr:nuclease-related domain-containing protein [Kiritimatiellia bacterium]HRU71277.1 nuclease-related domain-containing protein [Kiritimatiellia bacterium]
MTGTPKAEIHGVPGERVRAAGVVRALWPLLAALFACGLFAGAALPQVTLGVAGVGLLMAAAFLAWAVRDGLRGVDAYFKGARGEESVAVLLAALPRGYHVFHDFSFGGSGAIDHVVVGPSGLFAIETKCWSGRVTCEASGLRVDGVEPSRPPLRQARGSAQALVRFLGERLGSAPSCTPVVCFASDTFEPGLLTVDDVVVCNASALQSMLVTHAGHVTADERERIVKVMEQKDS